MEIKNLNFYGTEIKGRKRLHKKTISCLPQHCKPEKDKNLHSTKLMSSKVPKHHKTKSQENIKIKPFQWSSLLSQTVSNSENPSVVSKFAFTNRGGMAIDKKNKPNQDSYILIEHFLTKNRYLFGVCDGHGVNGHYVSEFIKEILP